MVYMSNRHGGESVREYHGDRRIADPKHFLSRKNAPAQQMNYSTVDFLQLKNTSMY